MIRYDHGPIFPRTRAGGGRIGVIADQTASSAASARSVRTDADAPMSDPGRPSAGNDQDGQPDSEPARTRADTFAPWSRAFLRHAALWLTAARVRQYGSQLLSGAGSLLGGVLRVASGIVGGIFQAAATALFTFYMVARGTQMRQAILSRFRPDRQRRILFIWEQAIGQTGGYFYSRLLLAVVNGALMYAVLRWRGVPFAAPLALFEGVVAEFIPVVGTYIAGALPVLVALLYDPVDALVVLIWILVYQQLENYLLSPRLTARTMALPAPAPFAAALIGGALGGILFAFLALPAAGVIQAAARAYGRYYEVVTDDHTIVPALAPDHSPRHRDPLGPPPTRPRSGASGRPCGQCLTTRAKTKRNPVRSLP